MSNLNMPRTTYAALTARFARGGRAVRTLCYATTVERHAEDPRFFVIRQHGNAIAEVGPMELYVTNAGWSSATTRARINSILESYRLPFYVSQRQGDQVLYQRTDDRHIELTRNFKSFVFDFTSNVYSLNGAAAVGY
jgi:hypothetical protein